MSLHHTYNCNSWRLNFYALYTHINVHIYTHIHTYTNTHTHTHVDHHQTAKHTYICVYGRDRDGVGDKGITVGNDGAVMVGGEAVKVEREGGDVGKRETEMYERIEIGVNMIRRDVCCCI